MTTVTDAQIHPSQPTLPLTTQVLRDLYVEEIQVGPAQIEMIVNTIRGRAPGCRLLVFGIGRDSAMWHSVNPDGRTLFVEDNDHWIQLAKSRQPELDILKVSYAGRTVADSLPVDEAAISHFPIPPELTAEDWDVILIDAPLGYDARCPGRSVPLTWVKNICRPYTHVFVDDYERPVERAWADKLIAPLYAQTVVVKRPAREMLWCVGQNSGFNGWRCKDVGGREHRLRFLLGTSRLRILMFHDSVDLIPHLVDSGLLDDRTHVYFSFSWCRDEAALRHLRNLLTRGTPQIRALLQHRCHFLLNSEAELAAFRSLLPEFDAFHFNNAALLNPATFQIKEVEARFTAVMNAKGLAFKRHELSVEVPHRLFLSYDVQERNDGATRTVDLNAYMPQEIRRNLPDAKVADALNEARVGLMLSAVEGACYASLEYLLCGLPVVSTASQGGRDDFYDDYNSRIVKSDPGSVRTGVEELLHALATGKVARAEIRERALVRRRKFLNILAKHMQGLIDAADLPLSATKLLDEAIAEGSKLKKHRNFWVQSLSQVVPKR